jgi:uncharacterized phiE125 gp8 family phage protein
MIDTLNSLYIAAIARQYPTVDAQYRLSIITPATSEPITYQELADHLRLDCGVDQTLVTGLGIAARRYFEQATKLTLMQTVFSVSFDDWGFWQNDIKLPRRPVSNVASVKYIDGNGTLQTLDPSQYQVDYKAVYTRIRPVLGTVLPVTQIGTVNAVTIQFTAGTTNDLSQVDELAKLAIKQLTSHWYESREAVLIGKAASALPAALDAILWLNAAPEV